MVSMAVTTAEPDGISRSSLETRPPATTRYETWSTGLAAVSRQGLTSMSRIVVSRVVADCVKRSVAERVAS